MSGAPSGTVTFLFTDIEGSTSLWEERPEAMRDALARHDEVLRAAVESRGGFVFSTGGDGLAAAFGRAGDAVGAAIAAQHDLMAIEWPSDVVLRVRMGLHTGEAQERDGDYFGPALNRAARLMAAGHGGQIVCSHATADVVGDALPKDVGLVDLGEHRLRDLTRSEHVFQIEHPACAVSSRRCVRSTRCRATCRSNRTTSSAEPRRPNGSHGWSVAPRS